jgi:hypothetical protein
MWGFRDAHLRVLTVPPARLVRADEVISECEFSIEIFRTMSFDN